MLPSEKAELWERRLGYAALILVVAFILIWMVRFITRITRDALEQRDVPTEGRAPVVETRDI
jgi:hypothetical protein